MKACPVLAVEDKWYVYYTNYMELEVIMLYILFNADQFQYTWAMDKFGIIIIKVQYYSYCFFPHLISMFI